MVNYLMSGNGTTMMPPTNFRRRRSSRRGDYTLLGNDSGSESSTRMGFVESPEGRQQSAHERACDGCWRNHIRRGATKACLICRQDMCEACANNVMCDTNRRPWWVPTFIFSCLKFMFSASHKPHSIVPLGSGNAVLGCYQNETGSYIHQASSGIRLPRVSSTERSSNRSFDRELGHSSRHSSYSDISGMLASSEAKKNSSRECLVKPRVKKVPVHDKRRTCGYNSKVPGKVTGYYPEEAEEREKQQRYKQNWDVETFPENDTNIYPYKMKGKDVDVELSGKEIKITVNKERPRNSRYDRGMGHVCYRPHRVPRYRHKFPDPYTEKLFNKVPIWFKHPSKQRKRYNVNEHKLNYLGKRSIDPVLLKADQCHLVNREPNAGIRSNQTLEERHRHWERFSTGSGSRHSNTSQFNEQKYTVEEPEDVCSICLEILSKSEARMLKCAHQLHTVCLNQLLKTADADFGIKCPVCSRTTPVKNYYAPRHLWFKELVRA